MAGRVSACRTWSATDACRDRLAAFYHWSDRQSLQAAVDIALRQHVDLATIQRWSKAEGALAKFDEFGNALVAARRDRKSGRRPETRWYASDRHDE